jgi:type II secretory pathway pseudopilin PulG
VVVIIISVLAMIGFASYRTVNQKARDGKRLSDMQQVRSALEMYKTNTGAYPICTPMSQACYYKASAPLANSLMNQLQGTYIDVLPLDPQEPTYYYIYVSNGSTYTLQYYQEANSSYFTMGNPL